MNDEKIEKYTLLGFKKRTSKNTGKEYHIAYILYEHQYGFDILNTIVKPQQVNALSDVIGDDTFELKRFMSFQYNSYTKSYNMFINYGL